MIMQKCKECGKMFQAKTCRNVYCKGPHIQVCAICGRVFEYTCPPSDKPNTCSKECKAKYTKKSLQEKYGVDNVSQIQEVRDKKKISNASEESQRKMKETCLAKYGVERANQDPEVRAKISNALKSPEVRAKAEATFKEHCGYYHIFASPEYREAHGCNTVSTLQSTKDSVKKSLMNKYGVSSVANIPGVTEKAQKTRVKTVQKKYGTDCIFKTKEFKEHIQEVYGVDNVTKNAEIWKKISRNQTKPSNLQIRLYNFLDAYNINYTPEYTLNNDTLGHHFDAYLIDYKILVDTDGEYWHAYLSDPDGERVRDDKDDVRVALIPKDHIFHLIVEPDFERGLRDLQKIIFKMDEGLFDYDTELFKWCRSVGFPCYNYSDERLFGDWKRLCEKTFDVYNENCRYAMSIINHFHRSIYDAHTSTTVSPREAWEDDKLLKRVIANRLIYQNDVNPAKVLQGFNISKIATKVSVFNPVLAKYLTMKYLSEFDEVVDPFSGFSGRLLGVSSVGKRYVGSDINNVHVRESQSIIDKLNLKRAEVSVCDILQVHDQQFDSMLTCPPYGEKEIYGSENVFQSCDDWIDICLERYNCKRYVFVVDKTTKYIDSVVEMLKCRSHFRKNPESVIVIDK